MITTSSVIQAKNLGKDFGNKTALDGIDLDIAPGSVIGVLGPNGSGKTTLLRNLIGLQLPSRGSVRVFGSPSASLGAEQMARIGFVSQESELIDWLTVGETLDLARSHSLHWDAGLADRLTSEFQLKGNDKVSGLSVGMKQRLAIVLGVAHQPDLVLLDEPAASLDPVARQDFLDLLMELVQSEGRTILISSHILTDVEKIVDKVLILDGGQLHCHQGLDELRETYFRITLSSLDGSPIQETAVNHLTGLKVLDVQGGQAVATVHHHDSDQVEKELGALPCQAKVARLSFEEIYRLIVTGK